MADAQVSSAIANWGPRFTAQGVDPGDFTSRARMVSSVRFGACRRSWVSSRPACASLTLSQPPMASGSR